MPPLPESPAAQPSYKVTFTSSTTTMTGPMSGEAPTDKVLGSMMGFPSMDTGILPPVIRSFNPTMTSFLVERTPFMAGISYKNCGARGPSRHEVYDIAIPWTTYHISLNNQYRPISVAMWCRNSQMYDESDGLAYLPLPNTYYNGGTCLGSAEFGYAPIDSIGEAISLAINAFWTSSFNADLSDWCNASHSGFITDSKGRGPGGSGINVLTNWTKLSVADVLELPWHKVTTVGEVLDNMNRHNAPFDRNSLVNSISGTIQRGRGR